LINSKYCLQLSSSKLT